MFKCFNMFYKFQGYLDLSGWKVNVQKLSCSQSLFLQSCLSGLKTVGVVGPTFKTVGVMGPKNSTDVGT